MKTQPAVITRVESVGLGHRVCADTLSILRKGQGMLVGNSSAFTFLVHAETERNEYVAARPFRVNAGAVHAYVRLPGDKTTYLGEFKAGQEVLIVDANGETSLATLGRVKIEVRPMLLVEAQVTTEDGVKTGAVFLQNAETIRLTTPGGEPVSVVGLKPAIPCCAAWTKPAAILACASAKTSGRYSMDDSNSHWPKGHPVAAADRQAASPDEAGARLAAIRHEIDSRGSGSAHAL